MNSIDELFEEYQEMLNGCTDGGILKEARSQLSAMEKVIRAVKKFKDGGLKIALLEAYDEYEERFLK